MQLDRALGRAAVGIGERGAQIGISQHAAAVVAQPDAGIVEPRRRRRWLACRRRDCASRCADASAPQPLPCRYRARRRARRARPASAVRAAVRSCGRLAAVRRMLGAAVLACAERRRGRRVRRCSGAVPHVGHPRIRDFVELRHRRPRALAHGERAARVAGAIDRLREDRERVRVARLDEHVERLGRRRAETRRPRPAARTARRRRRRSSSDPESARRRCSSPSR